MTAQSSTDDSYFVELHEMPSIDYLDGWDRQKHGQIDEQYEIQNNILCLQ